MRFYLFVRQIILVYCSLFLSLAACAPEIETAVSPTLPPAEATTIPAVTTTPPSATSVALVTAEALPLPATPTIPLPEPSPMAATAVVAATGSATVTPADPLVISPENAAQLTQLAQFGKGRIDSTGWSPDGEIFAVGGPQGIDFYEAQTLQLVRTIESGDESGALTSAVRFSPRGDVFILYSSGYEVPSLSLWDTASGKLLRSLDTWSSPVFAPDGQSVIFELSGTEQWVWQNIRTGETLHESSYPYYFSPAGEILVELYEGTTLRLYDIASGQLRRTIEAPAAVHGIVFSPQGDLLAAGSDDNVVRVWDAPGGELLHEVEGRTVVFSPDGRIMATLGEDNVVRIWDAPGGELLHELEGHTSGTYFVFSPDGRFMATLGDDNVVRVWNAPGGELLHEVEGHTSGTYFVFGPDGRIMVTLGDDNVVRIWDAPGGKLLHLLAGHEVVFSPDGRLLTTVSHEERSIRLWDLASGQLLHLLTLPHPPPGGSWWFAGFSPDWRELAVVSGGSVLFFDVASGALQRTLEGYCLRRILEGSCFASVAFSPDSNTLITVGSFEVRTLDVPSGRLRQTQTSDMPVSSIAISPDGQRMAWGGGEQGYYLQMWDAVSGQLLYTIEDEVEPVDAVAFSPDGQLLATQSWRHPMVHLRQASTGKLLFSHEARHLAFSPDGRLFATASATSTLADSAVELWDAATFQRMRRFEGLLLLAFSLDGNILAQRAVENDDGSWHIMAGWWDIDSGELLRPFVDMEPPSSVMAFGLDNHLLLGSNYSGYLTIWDGNSGNLLWGDGHGLTGAFSPNGRFLATVSGAGIVRLWGIEP